MPVRTRRQEKFLKSAGVVTVPARESFLASKVFMTSTDPSSPVKIFTVSNIFENWFGPMEVPAYGGGVLPYYELQSRSHDDSIFASLHGDDNVTTSLSEVWWLLQQQGRGESGPLLTNGPANIFYVRDRFDTFRTVYLTWRNSGWRIHAAKLCCSWGRGCRVFSRLIVMPEELPVDELLQKIDEITIQPVGGSNDLAAERFAVSLVSALPVIKYISEDFLAWFGKIRFEATSGSTLMYCRLTRRSNNSNVFKSLGGEELCLTRLSDIWLLIEQQPNCEDGLLLSSRKGKNIFYVRDCTEQVRVVIVRGNDRVSPGWCITAKKVKAGNLTEFDRLFVPGR